MKSAFSKQNFFYTQLPRANVYYSAQGVVLTFESADKIPKCDHSNETY